MTDRPPPTDHRAPIAYARRLSIFSATMLVVGGIIGSGIFLNPSIVAARVGSPELTMGVWVIGAAIALIGAFIFAELGQRRPEAGGGYVYLREAYGALPAFLYAWALLLVVATGAAAAVAVTFGRYAGALMGLGPGATVPLAVGAIVLLSAVNILGVMPGAVVQNVFTVLKLGALGALIAAGLALPVDEGVRMATVCLTCEPLLAPASLGGVIGVVGTALVPVLFAYGGWQQTNYVAEEIVDPERNLPRALVAGVSVVVLVYLLANLAYLRVLGVEGLAASSAPAADAMYIVMGPAGRALIAAGIAVSTFGFLGLVILVTPRVYQAMAGDGLFFASFARLHPRFRTPATAIAFQGAWAVLLVFSGSYGELLDAVVFADWIFFGAVASTLLVLRRRDRGAPGPAPACVPFYPWSVLLFMGAAAYVVAGSVASNPRNALLGVAMLLAGVPVFLFWQARHRESGGE